MKFAQSIATTFGLVATIALGSLGCADVVGDAEYDGMSERNAETVENLLAAGYSMENIEIRESAFVGDDLILNEFEPLVFIDSDTHVTLEASREMLEQGGKDTSALWHTPNLVTNNRTICLAKVTNAQSPYTSYALTSQMQTGVNWARNNFNKLSSFNLTMVAGNASLNSAGQLSHSIGGCDYSIFIYKVNGGAGGSAGFPSGGAPYGQVKLNSGLAGYSNNAHEHVATHEIGHSIGLRHADWKTRASCGQNTNEGQSGAVRISGTADQTTTSLMASCFASNTNGEFRGEDAKALNTLY